MNGKDDSVYVNHILDSIGAIEEFSRNLTKEELASNRLKRSAIIREIEVIGEAVRNTSSAFQKKYPEVGWKDIIGTRDKMIHHYFGVDLNIVWNIIKVDLPVLKKQVSGILRDIKK
ncbi:MAG: DUF86 domain-containing protein [Candidatus Woesearchaeota archaeon]